MQFLESFFMDLFVNVPEDQNYNDKSLRAMVKILMDNLASNRTVYHYY
jgi:hypothetical protein